jgi:hypothetical protein
MTPKPAAKKAQYGLEIGQYFSIIERNRTKANIWFDLALSTILLSTLTSAFVNIHLHKWLGGGMAVVVFIHLVLHWRWIEAVSTRFLRKMPFPLRFKAVLNVLSLAVFLLLILSGAVVSLIYAPGATHFHKLCFFIFIGLALFHLALNWKWVASYVKCKRIK